MAKFKGKFESTKQDWETPDWLFSEMNSWYDFQFDLAASKKNAKCDKYFTQADDALEQDWTYLGRCWLNPPYGGNSDNRLSRWVQKAYESAKWPTCMVVMLMPARTNTSWWHDYCMKAGTIWFIKGRPKFGGAKYGLPQPLAIVVFTGLAVENPMLRSLLVAEKGTICPKD
jgi:phage N-6-adenine-methyltransferase